MRLTGAVQQRSVETGELGRKELRDSRNAGRSATCRWETSDASIQIVADASRELRVAEKAIRPPAKRHRDTG